MKTTAAFLLHLLLHPLVLLLAPGGPIASAFEDQCFATSTIKDHKYHHIGEGSKTADGGRSTTKYVEPQQDLKILLQAQGNSGAIYATEFLLEKELCFVGVGQWSVLLMEVKRVDTDTNNSPVKPKYEFQVRTSECVRLCNQTVNFRHLNTLNIWASGASKWKDSHSNEHCGNIPNWKAAYSHDNFIQCKEANLTKLLKMTPPPIIATSATVTSTPTMTTTTSATTTTTTISPINAPATDMTTSTTSTSATDNQPAGQTPPMIPIIGGVIAGVVVVAVLVMIVVKKRRNQPTTEAVAMRPQSKTESPRDEDANSLYEAVVRQEPALDTADRQASTNSLYGTVERRGSANSLYEPVENFRAT